MNVDNPNQENWLSARLEETTGIGVVCLVTRTCCTDALILLFFGNGPVLTEYSLFSH